MAKILICDDEPGLRALIRCYAQAEGYETVEAADGREAVELCQNQAFDMIIMDLMMPHLDGFSAVEIIRKKADTPIMMLSGNGEEYDRIRGFELGVDDYVVKPFSPKEIMMRVGAILRRIGQVNHHKQSVFEKEGLRVDQTGYRVFIDNEEIVMAPKVYDLLFLLLDNKGKVVSREEILQVVWGYDSCGDDRTLDTHMKLVRKALGPYAHFITTIRGLGYRFDGN